MAECGVCWEIFEGGGAKCPKLLPCNHTVCVSCLKELEMVKRNGRIKCPFCRKRHKIPRAQIEDFPTNQLFLTKVPWKTNRIYTLPSSGGARQIDTSIEICELHENPVVTIRYNVIEGKEQRFCETCLNENSGVTSGRESENQTGQNVSRQHFENSFIDNDTTNGKMERENNFSKLRPTWQPTRYDMVENTEQVESVRQYCNSVDTNRNKNSHIIRIFKHLVFALCFPVIIGVGLFIVLVTIPIGVIICPFCTTYFFFRCRGCHLYDDTFHCISNLISRIFDRFAYLITRLFCWDVEDYDSRIYQTCQIVAQGVSLIVIGWYLAGLIITAVAFFIGSLVWYA